MLFVADVDQQIVVRVELAIKCNDVGVACLLWAPVSCLVDAQHYGSADRTLHQQKDCNGQEAR